MYKTVALTIIILFRDKVINHGGEGGVESNATAMWNLVSRKNCKKYIYILK